MLMAKKFGKYTDKFEILEDFGEYVHMVNTPTKAQKLARRLLADDPTQRVHLSQEEKEEIKQRFENGGLYEYFKEIKPYSVFEDEERVFEELTYKIYELTGLTYEAKHLIDWDAEYSYMLEYEVDVYFVATPHEMFFVMIPK